MSQTSPRRLTEAFVDGLPLGAPCVIRDTKVTGLLVAVNKHSKSYKVQRDLWRGERGQKRLIKTVRHMLGSADEMTLEEARHKAEDVIRLIKRGIDPNAPSEVVDAACGTLETLYDHYAADLRTREKTERTVEGVLHRRDVYLTEWKTLPLDTLTRTMVRAKHQDLSQTRGKVIANHVMRDLRAAYNLALRIIDDPDQLPDNPVKAVTFNKERRRDAVIMPDDLAAWWQKVQALSNPLRRLMHELGLLSGLRPGTLVALRREWIDLKNRLISIPRMKSGRAFDLPLSERMASVVERALTLSELLYPGAAWLFPTRASKADVKTGIQKGDVIATQVWKEKSLPSETGHILRHTYRTIAQRIGVDKIDARLLLDHTVPGIDGVYLHEKALFGRLLDVQRRMSDAIAELIVTVPIA